MCQPPHQPSGQSWGVLGLLVTSFGFTGSSVLYEFPWKLSRYTVAYLLPYLLCAFWISIPILYIQFRLGAQTGCDVIGILKKGSPILKGAGISCLLSVLWSVAAGQAEAAITTFYLFTSCEPAPLWSSCNSSWNHGCSVSSGVYSGSAAPSSPEYQFYQKHVVDTSGVLLSGHVIPRLVVALLVVWIVTWLLTAFGQRAYVLLQAGLLVVGVVAGMVVLGRGLGGSSADRRQAIASVSNAFYTADWSTLFSLQIWSEAALDHVITFSLWMGIFPTLGRLSGTRNIISRFGWLFAVCCVVILQHISVFVLTPFLAVLQSRDQTSATHALLERHSGEQFIFQEVTWSFGRLDPDVWPRVLPSVFFTYVLVFQMATSVMRVFLLATVAVAVLSRGRGDQWKHRKVARPAVTAAICGVGFAIGMMYCTQAGREWRELNQQVQYTFHFLLIALQAAPFLLAYNRLTELAAEKIVMTVWYAMSVVMVTAALLHRMPPWSWSAIYDRLHALDAHPVGLPLCYLIALGPLAVGMLVGALHEVCTYAGPADRRWSYLVLGRWTDTSDAGGRRTLNQPTAEDLYESFSTFADSGSLHRAVAKIKASKRRIMKQRIERSESERENGQQTLQLSQSDKVGWPRGKSHARQLSQSELFATSGSSKWRHSNA